MKVYFGLGEGKVYFNINTLIYILLYLSLMIVYPREMFPLGVEDGFYSQISYIDDNLRISNILSIIHILRYVIVYPFWILSGSEVPGFFQSLSLLLYIMPLLLMNTGRWFRNFKYLILLMPFLFSYRTVLVMLSINILFFYATCYQKSKARLVYALFLANLSSGVLIPFVFILLVMGKAIGLNKKNHMALALVAGCLIVPSVIHKVYYFSEGVYQDQMAIAQEESYDLTCKGSSICTMLKRSTIYMSYETGQFTKFWFYISLTIMTLFCCIYSVMSRQRVCMFFLVALVGVFFEGLWLVSFASVVLIFWLGIIVRFFYFNIKNTKIRIVV